MSSSNRQHPVVLDGGLFITFEGGEGAGKTTQAKYLSKKLRHFGYQVVLTREPGGTDGGEEIRSLVLKGAENRWTPKTEALLMYAARQEHLIKKIKPALEEGKIVLCDRFSDSSKAYQGVAHGLGLEKINDLDKWVMGGFKPDLTILLDQDPEIGLSRNLEPVRIPERDGAEFRFENMALSFHQKLRDGFLTLAERDPDRFITLAADQKVDSLAGCIWKVCEEKLLHPSGAGKAQ